MIKAIVTGHSQGLGAALAAALLEKGIAVLGLSRQGNAVLRTRHGAPLQEEAIDLADTEALAAWSEGPELALFLRGARQVLLINNAGILGPVGALPAHDAAGLARALALNVTAPLILSAAFMRAGAGASDLRIAHISSGAARSAYPGWSVYGATKAALDHHARATALDAIPGLRICSIAPGVIDTGMQAQVRAASLADFPQRERFDALKRDGALATPEAAAGALVAHLLSDQFAAQAVADIRTLA